MRVRSPQNNLGQTREIKVKQNDIELGVESSSIKREETRKARQRIE